MLAPKELLDANPATQILQYSFEGKDLNIDTLSSGEQEVINIVFDFLLREPSDSIVMFDEPELHLHPELCYRMLFALQDIGKPILNKFTSNTKLDLTYLKRMYMQAAENHDPSPFADIIEIFEYFNNNA